jgi:hypothetical protein
MHRSFYSQKEHANAKRFFGFPLKLVSKEEILIKEKKAYFYITFSKAFVWK